jgi:hypothetical protein
VNISIYKGRRFTDGSYHSLRSIRDYDSGLRDPGSPLFQGWAFGPFKGENMRIALNVVGAVLVFLGTVWFLQGVNVLPGSFMTGQMRWAVRGGIAAIVGIALLIWANRKR